MASAILEVQEAIVTAIKADATLGALIADRIYDEVPDHVMAVDASDDVHALTAPAFDAFIVIQGVSAEPWDRIGTNNIGERIRFDLHAFSRGNGSVEVKQIGGALRDLLHRSELSLATQEMGWGQHLLTTYDVASDSRTWIAMSEFAFFVHP